MNIVLTIANYETLNVHSRDPLKLVILSFLGVKSNPTPKLKLLANYVTLLLDHG